MALCKPKCPGGSTLVCELMRLKATLTQPKTTFTGLVVTLRERDSSGTRYPVEKMSISVPTSTGSDTSTRSSCRLRCSCRSGTDGSMRFVYFLRASPVGPSESLDGTGKIRGMEEGEW